MCHGFGTQDPDCTCQNGLEVDRPLTARSGKDERCPKHGKKEVKKGFFSTLGNTVTKLFLRVD